MPPPQALRPKRDDTLLSDWESMPERAPSVLRQDQPTLVRFLAMIGMCLLLLGVLPILLAVFWQRESIVGVGWGFVLASLGLYLVVLHAFRERDMQFRQLYAILGVSLLVVGLVFRVLPGRDGLGTYFPLVGVPTLTIGLVFLVAVLRNESDSGWRSVLLIALGVVAFFLNVIPIAVGFFRPDYLAGEGALVLLLGLLFIGTRLSLETSGETAYRIGLGLEVLGASLFLTALLVAFSLGSAFLVPGGLILMTAAVGYLALGLGTCSDATLVVIARRELASFFYSPIAYLVFTGMLIVGWFTFFMYVRLLFTITDRQGGVMEPIFRYYVYNLIPVIVQMFVVPVLTMRLLAEEKRTGSLEVLLTAPINEWTVVLGKFLGTWLFYLLLWVPSFVFLVGLRYVGGDAFDYHPILSFLVALLASSAGFIAMGLFFSSVTSNQIVAAVFTFVGMTAHLVAHFIKDLPIVTPFPTLVETLTYVNYLDLWLTSTEGILAPRYLLFHVSAAFFFLFLATKVLEARKWK